MGVFDLAGTTASGWLSDRWDSRRLLAWYYGLRGLSLLFLPFALSAPGVGLPVFAVFYGPDWIVTVPPRRTTRHSIVRYPGHRLTANHPRDAPRADRADR